MKILIVTPYLGAVYGGTSKAITELIQELGQSNIQLDLITTNANGIKKLDVPLQEWISEKNCRVQYFPCWHRNDLVISLSLVKWLFQHVTDYQVVHTHTIFSPMISIVHWICKSHNVSYLMTPHGMLEQWALSYKAWKKRVYLHLFEKSALQNASAIQALALPEANSIKKLIINQSTIVIPNGIHRHHFEPLTPPDTFYQHFPGMRNKILILFLGRIDPKKGLDILASSYAKVCTHFLNTHLILAGPDSIGFLPTVQQYFEQAGCLDSVTFAGMFTGQLKYAALSAASVFVCPSYSEGFSMSVLEGMASGLPCVITTECNFPEAAEAEVAHVVSTNSDVIADALIQCLREPQQAKDMGIRARQFILENYTWKQSAQKLLQVYESISKQESVNNLPVKLK